MKAPQLTNLRIGKYPYRRDPATGRSLCRYCSTPVTPPRQTFCSKACVDEFMLRTDTGFLRRKTLERDGGVCAKCGTDCEKLQASVTMASWHRANPEPRRKPHKQSKADFDQLWAVWEKRRHLERARREEEARQLQAKGWPHPDRSFWEADHILPVAEGGGTCGLENIQTLCVLCHRVKTAEQAKRRRKCSRV